jgi:Tudor domain
LTIVFFYGCIEFTYHNFSFSALQNPAGKYVDLRLADASLLFDIIPNDDVLSKIITSISLDIQKTMMLTKKKQNDEVGCKLGTLNESPEVKRTDEFNFMPNSEFQMVKITAFDEGVNSFFVRFKSKMEECRNFILKLNALADKLVPLRIIPSSTALNTICLAKYDNRIYRAKIVQVDGKLPNNSVVVQLLESGFKVTVNVDKLFKISDDIASVPPFAKRFKLVNFKPKFVLEPKEIDFYFRRVTKEKNLKLKLANDIGEFKIVSAKCCFF